MLNRATQITTNLFGLFAAVVQCSDQTTLDDFSNGILVPGQAANDPSVAKVYAYPPSSSQCHFFEIIV